MPRGQVDYEKGLIYKLCCKDPNVKEIYVGSTTNFRTRKSGHRISCHNPNDKDYNAYKYQFIRRHGGYDNWDMILVENYPTTSKRELEKREEELRKELAAELNMKKAYVTEEERKEYEKSDERLQKGRERKAKKRANETPEERETRLKKDREKRANETPEEREERLQKERDRKANESPEKRETRLEKHRESNSRYRAKKKAQKEAENNVNNI